MNRAFFVCLILSLLSALPTARADSPVTSAFTYQGELRSRGTPANGTYFMRFRLFDQFTGGNQIGSELQARIEVVNGLFTVQLDFGPAPFAGRARWLEIRVSTLLAGPFTTLTPRQSLTAAPYALHALSGNPGPTGPTGPTGPAGPDRIIASVNMQFSQDDRVGWTRIESLGDDQCFGSIPLGFTFTGWGLSVSEISVSSNGFLIFGNSCSTAFTNTALPANITSHPMLAFFWDDLRDFGTDQFIEIATLGSAGGRVFNLYFRNRFLSNVCGADSINLMISIHESSNLINVVYSGMSGCTLSRGNSATFGLQGPGGTGAEAVMIGFNSPILDDNAPRQSMSFQPPR
ncbi:MAG: hypothetical protein JNK25_14725 [Phycisphaerae bacterium]|nr:hypothetical protein [Phycisphaerae bacterium]